MRDDLCRPLVVAKDAIEDIVGAGDVRRVGLKINQRGLGMALDGAQRLVEFVRYGRHNAPATAVRFRWITSISRSRNSFSASRRRRRSKNNPVMTAVCRITVAITAMISHLYRSHTLNSRYRTSDPAGIRALLMFHRANCRAST